MAGQFKNVPPDKHKFSELAGSFSTKSKSLCSKSLWVVAAILTALEKSSSIRLVTSCPSSKSKPVAPSTNVGYTVSFVPPLNVNITDSVSGIGLP